MACSHWLVVLLGMLMMSSTRGQSTCSHGEVTNQPEVMAAKGNRCKETGYYIYMGLIWEKGHIGNFSNHEKCGTCLHKFDCRETTLSNAANHFKIFLIEFEICLYKHLYFYYIRNPLFPIVVFISMLWQLKVNMFYPKNSFPIV